MKLQEIESELCYALLTKLIKQAEIIIKNTKVKPQTDSNEYKKILDLAEELLAQWKIYEKSSIRKKYPAISREYIQKLLITLI